MITIHAYFHLLTILPFLLIVLSFPVALDADTTRLAAVTNPYRRRSTANTTVDRTAFQSNTSSIVNLYNNSTSDRNSSRNNNNNNNIHWNSTSSSSNRNSKSSSQAAVEQQHQQRRLAEVRALALDQHRGPVSSSARERSSASSSPSQPQEQRQQLARGGPTTTAANTTTTTITAGTGSGSRYYNSRGRDRQFGSALYIGGSERHGARGDSSMHHQHDNDDDDWEEDYNNHQLEQQQQQQHHHQSPFSSNTGEALSYIHPLDRALQSLEDDDDDDHDYLVPTFSKRK
jgi:hypothetical protein